jgi:hypothetical protein
MSALARLRRATSAFTRVFDALSARDIRGSRMSP